MKIKNWDPLLKTDKKYIKDVLRRKVLSGQEAFYTKKFEQAWSEYLGIKHTILTNSGTAGLHMAVEALGIKEGDEIIMPVVSFTSTALCVLYPKAVPVFCDIKKTDLNIDENKIEEKITAKTKAIIVVHLNGFAANMEKIIEIAQKHNLKIIEDACQAHGAKIDGKPVGTFGDIGVFSLNRFKNLPAGEGGMFVTNNEKLFESAKVFYNIGVIGAPASFNSQKVGYMYRSTEFTAALAYGRLPELYTWNKKRRENARRLNEAIDKINLFETLKPLKNSEPVYWKYLFKVKSGDVAYIKKISQFLRDRGVAVSEWQKYSLPEHEVFKKFDNGNIDLSKSINNQTIWLENVVNPLNGKKEIDFAIDIVKKAARL